MKCDICGNEIKMINIGLGIYTSEINSNQKCEFCGKHLCNNCTSFAGFTIIHCKSDECVDKVNEEFKNYKTVEEQAKMLKKTYFNQ